MKYLKFNALLLVTSYVNYVIQFYIKLAMVNSGKKNKFSTLKSKVTQTTKDMK